MLKGGWKTHKFTPFDPVSKRITAEVEKDGKKYTCAKGAPNAILKLAKFEPSTVEAYRNQSQEFAARGFRSLGVAVKQDNKEWELLGMLCMFDPPRGDTRQTIDEARELGIQVKVCPVFLGGTCCPLSEECGVRQADTRQDAYGRRCGYRERDLQATRTRHKCIRQPEADRRRHVGIVSRPNSLLFGQ